MKNKRKRQVTLLSAVINPANFLHQSLCKGGGGGRGWVRVVSYRKGRSQGLTVTVNFPRPMGGERGLFRRS
jgi:hypothetical protein